MKKILLFLVSHFIIGATAFAQQSKVYTLDLKDGSFLLEQNGKTAIRPEKDGQTFVINMDSLKLDTLFIENIILSASNNNEKTFVVKDSIKKELVSTKVTQKIHEGETGFEKKLQLVKGNYDISWGDVTWKVSILSSGLETKKQGEEKTGNDTGTMVNKEEKGKTIPLVEAIFAILIAALVGLIYWQRNKILKWYTKLKGDKQLFDEFDNGVILNLAAYAKQNKKMVRYEEGKLSLKEGTQTLTISLPKELQVKGDKLKIKLANSLITITSIYYDDNDTPKEFITKKKQQTLVWDIDGEQYIKKISITPKDKIQRFLIESLTLETIPKAEDPEEPQQDRPIGVTIQGEIPEKNLLSVEFQQSLLDLFNEYDSYKELDEKDRLTQLQRDLYLITQQKAHPHITQDEEDKVKIAEKERSVIKNFILTSLRKNNYVLSLYKQHNESKEDFWDILDALLSKDIEKPVTQKTPDIPLSERLDKKNGAELATVKAFVMREYFTPLRIPELDTTTFDNFRNSLASFFQNLKKEDEPKDLVKELVSAVNSQLAEDKQLKDDNFEQQLIERLSMPTNFDEAEQKVWKIVAELLGVDIVNARTLEGEINKIIQNKVQSKIEEELPVKLEEKKTEVQQQDLNDIKDALSDTIDDVQGCKTIAHVMQKVKGQISGVRDREKNAIANIRNAYHEQVGKDMPENIELKEAVKKFRINVPESVRKQEWEKVADIINSLGFGEQNDINEATLPSALGIYYEGRLQKEVTSQLNDLLKADRKDIEAVVEELNKTLNIANEAETLCEEYKTETITELKDQLEAIITEVKKEKVAVEKESKEKAAVISTTIDSMRERLNTSVTELGKLISKAGYLMPCTNDDEDSENVADRNQEAMIEQFENLKESLLAALPNDGVALTPAEAKAKVQNVFEGDIAKAFENKDLSQFSVIDKIARYYAYSRLPFMTKNAQEANSSKSLRSYGVVFNRSRMTGIYAQMNQLLSDFGIQLIMPSLFAERLGEGHYNRSTNDGDLAILCPHPEYWKQTIANADKKDIIIDIAAIGYNKNGQLVKETEVIINNN